MYSVDELPYLTAEVPGTGGVIKTRPEDFRVDEVPLYEPSGSGTHVYFRIEKTSMPTMDAVAVLARILKRNVRDFGYAGLKDADAVTTQMISLEHTDPAAIEAIDHTQIRILDTSLHTNKLKLGHLKGNRFRIRIRQVDPARVNDVRRILETLSVRGVPNYFGPQRFGLRGDNWKVGRAVLKDDYETAAAVLLGRSGPRDYGDVRRARELFDEGRYDEAAEAWPYPFHNERRMLRALAKGKGKPKRAFAALDRKIKRFYFAAYQSQLFNQVVAARLQKLDRLEVGDLAWRHPQGAIFWVENLEKEQPRCDAFEISPTGPLYGYRMSLAKSESGTIEHELIAQEELTLEVWKDGDKQRMKGNRRPLRFQPQEIAVSADEDDAGPYIETRFFLESGCYATTVLREVCKSDLAGEPETD